MIRPNTCIMIAMLALAVVDGAMAGTAAAAQELNGARIRQLLSGNSIIHPGFGCVFFRRDGTARIVGQGGVAGEQRWEVRDDLYYSTGQCGIVGCRLTGEYPSFTFRRTDGGYEQPVILVRGNHCEKNGIIS